MTVAGARTCFVVLAVVGCAGCDRAGSAMDAAHDAARSPGDGGAHAAGDMNGGAPPGGNLGWRSLAHTTVASVCPSAAAYPAIQGVDGCASVIGSWSGGIADTHRDRLILWGGGRDNYYGNELYAVGLADSTVTRLTDPSPPSLCAESGADGKPTSRHTYDNLAFLPAADRMFVFGGLLACDRSLGSSATWTLDLANLTWKSMDPHTGGTPDGTTGLVVSDYDPTTRKIFLHDPSNFWSYDYDTNTYALLRANTGIGYRMKAVVDPKRSLFFIIGCSGCLYGGVKVFSIAPDSSYAMQDWQVTGCGGLLDAEYPGLAYDATRDRIVGWSGGDTVYLLDPDTRSCTTQTYPSGPAAQQVTGTHGRFRFFPRLDSFVVVNDWMDDARALRLPR